MKNKKIVFKYKHLYKDDPVDRLRGKVVISELQKRGWNVEEFNNQKNIDIIVFLGDDLFDKIIYKYIDAKCIIQDLQDNHLGSNQAKSYHNKMDKTSLYQKIKSRFDQGLYYGIHQLALKYLWNKTYKEYVKNVDHIVTSSYSLAEKITALNPNTLCIPDSININNLQKDIYNFNGKISIGWIGTQNNVVYLSLVEKALERLSKQYDIELVIISSKEVRNNFKFMTKLVEWKLETFENELLNCDIAIAPIPDGIDKSTNKILSYLKLAMPVVCSGSKDYQLLHEKHTEAFEFIENNNDVEWYDKLKKLIEDHNKRESLGEKGYKLAQEFDIEKLVVNYEKLFAKILTR